MAAINYDLVRWSLKQWLGGLLLIFALHLFLIWHLSAPEALPRLPSRPTPRVAVGQPTRDAPTLLEDPLLFATAHPDGFSGAAWVKKPQRNYALSTRLPNPNFLDTVAARSLFPETLPAPGLVAPSVPRARPAQDSTPALAYSRESELRIEGPLTGRSLLKEVKLPLQRHNDVLENTVVEAGVSPEGFVLSARVIDPSGLKKADQEALAITRSMRFNSIVSTAQNRSPENLTWGKLIFDWFTLDLAGTNAPPK